MPALWRRKQNNTLLGILVLGLDKIEAEAEENDGAMVRDTLREAGGHLAKACEKTLYSQEAFRYRCQNLFNPDSKLENRKIKIEKLK